MCYFMCSDLFDISCKSQTSNKKDLLRVGDFDCSSETHKLFRALTVTNIYQLVGLPILT